MAYRPPQQTMEGASTMKVAIYARVSTKDKGQEVDNQLVELHRFAGTQEWEIQAEYIDHETGKHSNREEFKRMFHDASQRKFDVVLFWSLDRLTREGALETLQHLNTLSSYGVGFRSFREPYLDSCGMFKDAVIAILGTIAKQESHRLSERVKAGLQRRKAQGLPIGRKKVILDRERLLRLKDEGLSLRQIAERIGARKSTVARRLEDKEENNDI